MIINQLKNYIQMKKIFLFLFLIPYISYCQTYSDYLLQKSKKVDWNETICTSEKNCFYVISDKDLFFEFLYYLYGKDGNKQLIDSSWIDGYGSTLHSYFSQKNTSYVVLWEIEGEHFPTFNSYYLKDGKIIKIGEWGISSFCETCDYSGYLIGNIRVYQYDEEIQFSFLEDLAFLDLKKGNYDDWGLFAGGELIVSFNIADGTVKKVDKRGNK